MVVHQLVLALPNKLLCFLLGVHPVLHFGQDLLSGFVLEDFDVSESGVLQLFLQLELLFDVAFSLEVN